MSENAPERPERVGLTFQPGIYDRVLDCLPGNGPLKIMDAGAGVGFFSHKLKERGHDVHACDMMEPGENYDGITYHKCDLTGAIPVPDGAYDCTVSIEVIEHVENHFPFMDELVRITKPGGHIIITTPNIVDVSARLQFMLTGFNACAPIPLDPTRPNRAIDHINPISLPQIMYHFERLDCEICQLTTNRYRKGAWLWGWFLYPLAALALRLRFYQARRKARKRGRDERTETFARYRRWMMHPATQFGRIMIAIAKRSQG